jgi:preprotein translocase subunit SecD
MEEADDLAALLSAGPLPARLRVVDQQVSKAAPSRRFWLSLGMTALAVLFVLFCALLFAVYRRGGRPRPLGLLLFLALFSFGAVQAHAIPTHVRWTLAADDQAAVPELMRVLRDRLDRLDVEGTVERQGEHIVVDMPRVKDIERVRQILTRTVFLELRLVRFPEGGGGSPSMEAVLEHFGGQFPPELELLVGDAVNEEGLVTGKPIGKQYYAVERTRLITDRDIRTARTSRSHYDEPIVKFYLTPEAGQVFRRATEANIGSGIAIVIDGEVISAPRIQARIDDEGIIEGGFSEREAQDLALLLGSGPLPARLRVVDQQVSKAGPDRRFWLAMTALAVFFVLFVTFLVVLYRRGGQPRSV